MTCGVGRRHSSDPTLLWLWCKLKTTAPIGPLAWEPPYTASAALEKTKRPKKKKNTVDLFNIQLEALHEFVVKINY